VVNLKSGIIRKRLLLKLLLIKLLKNVGTVAVFFAKES
jgi:hypothetical protein